MKNPWVRVMGNVRLSAKNGAAGGRNTTLLKEAGYTKEQIAEKLSGGTNKEVNIDKEYLADLFEKQGGKCYWLKTPIDPNDAFIAHHPLAPSVDRLDNDKGYIKGNVVITTRFANRGRCNAEDNFFQNECLPLIISGLKQL
jgi:hypothetical protein